MCYLTSSTLLYFFFFFFSSRRRHTRYIGDWSSDVCSSDLAAAFRWRRQGRHDTDVRNPVLDARPLVEPPCPFHQERLDGNAHSDLGRHLAIGFLVEREVAFVPAHHLEHDFFDLKPNLPLHLALGDYVERHEDLAQAALIAQALLHVARALEVGFGDLPGPQQHRPQRMGIGADLGRDDDTVVEVDRPVVVTQLRRDAQRARLAAQVEQLEDIMDAELAQRSLDRHQAASGVEKMCCKSTAVRACMRARWANGPPGSMRVTRSHASTASE